MTKRELADLVGVKYPHIQKLGREPDNAVSTELLVRICTTLGVDIADIVALEPNPEYDYHTLLENDE
jgi:DNA-binding Xre family transcriptional regulator